MSCEGIAEVFVPTDPAWFRKFVVGGEPGMDSCRVGGRLAGGISEEFLSSSKVTPIDACPEASLADKSEGGDSPYLAFFLPRNLLLAWRILCANEFREPFLRSAVGLVLSPLLSREGDSKEGR
jgi:hypothetical protein